MSEAPKGLRHAPLQEGPAYEATAPFKLWVGDMLIVSGEEIAASPTFSDANAVAASTAEAGERFYWRRWATS